MPLPRALVTSSTAGALTLGGLAGGLVLAPATQAADTVYYSISGVVVTPKGKAVEQSKPFDVQALDSSGEVVASAQTYAKTNGSKDSVKSGYFYLEVPSTGRYTVTITRTDYPTRTLKNVKVTKAQPAKDLHKVLLVNFGTKLTAKAPKTVKAGKGFTVKVDVGTGKAKSFKGGKVTATGTVKLKAGGKVVDSASVKKGKAVLKAKKVRSGRTTYSVVYGGQAAQHLAGSQRSFTVKGVSAGHRSSRAHRSAVAFRMRPNAVL
ncbi:carboxypeptidase-like regulatory domain-containing protein [Nocardioides sp. GY 10127]|uniref:carboxypeptidase-like regulatory domain-containing protein n=1 Tax=Nocardioides sp. GY 10127 TaxID=2569762 RepID=UPI0010A915A3|nr:carboxypeptidase-like regulatory domain-containing protein [Nocardioides sp. GY 10127]TIC79384.1 carboxypeptidase regulatory-like domain-containing protein [Nocardioides sp. GY 10127]